MTDSSDTETIQRLHEACENLRRELAKVVVGQSEVVEQLLAALFAGGHCLLVGVPGLAKTLLVRTLAEALSLDFNRIQFTPDLMPSDITGADIIQQDGATGERTFRFLPGPVFANVVLADEINRTPPKTQAALLEAMQERQVTAGGQRRELPRPFFVLATQNPIEQEGTYPLPEAQLDRFMMEVLVDYPSEDEELAIVKQTTADFAPTATATLSADEIDEFTHLVRRVPVADHVARLALQLARRTRVGRPEAAAIAEKYVRWGAGPRASQHLVLVAKARAAMDGRFFVDEADIRAVAKPVLRHRIITNYAAEADGVTPDDIVDELAATTKPGTT
ncbi:MAG: AAA family ATPase [Planctomycetales bacterium]|nr:AAA family ATPase [Planctomycetales bacterium]